jgi:hypothetical protein
MAQRVNHQEIVGQLLETKAVDFDAIGKAFAQSGPSLALADEPWESFCGTMRGFIRLFILGPGPGPIFGDLNRLQEESGDLRG